MPNNVLGVPDEMLDAFLDNTAALMPPDGVTSNFTNPDNQNPLAWFVLALFLFLSTVCVILRGYARLVLLRKVQIEEVMTFIAYVFFWAMLYPSVALILNPGYFVRQWDVTYRQLSYASYLFLLFGVFYVLILPLLKVAILIEWIRLFVPAGNRMRSPFFIVACAIITLQVLTGIATVILLNLQCIPHSGIWEFWIERKCYPLLNVQLTSASVQVFSDVVMLLLPQHVIWTLQMTWQKRLGVSGVFGLGLIATISSIFRLADTVTFGNASDAIYNFPPVVFWACAECVCGFIIICLPCIPKILRDSGVIRRIKKTFGMKVTENGSRGASHMMGKYGNGGPSHIGTGLGTTASAHKMGTRVGTTSDAYYRIDEDGMPMANIKASESTERLRDPEMGRGAGGVKITRITQVTVSQDNHSGSEMGDKSAPWGR